MGWTRWRRCPGLRDVDGGRGHVECGGDVDEELRYYTARCGLCECWFVGVVEQVGGWGRGGGGVSFGLLFA
jgi:hypothetical protein